MSAAKALDQEITSYLVQLSTKQKQAVLTVVKTFAGEHEEESPWKDKNFIAEMDRRVAELESGKEKGHSWEEVKQRARHSLKSRKRK